MGSQQTKSQKPTAKSQQPTTNQIPKNLDTVNPSYSYIQNAALGVHPALSQNITSPQANHQELPK